MSRCCKLCVWGFVGFCVVWCMPLRSYAQTRKRVVRLEALRVEGQIQKPQAFYILQRSDLSYETAQERRSFVHKTIDSVKKLPF